ncbi:asparagine synthase (glutamine-hydrolyzing) [Desulfocurvus sp. DL9XJH121]
MCGIAGFWGPARPADDFPGILGAMNQAMPWRGPDARGTYADSEAGLGLAHVRLSILDLSPAGAQPMATADGRFVLAYNGEAYDYMDLRADLDARGLAPEDGWRGHSDTEVILQGARTLGLEATLERLRGMFALALWDRDRRTLTLARDRLGIKPLYYGFAGPTLLFGSTLAPLKRHPDWRGGVDRGALRQYLRTLYVPEPWTIHENLRKLEPGAVLTVAERDIAARTLPEPARWWSVNQAVERALAAPFTGDEAQAEDELERLLTEAVALRTVSDVPLGAFLSGGIDSSTVAALLQKVSSGPVKTFTIGFAEAGYDEAAHAEAVARHLGTDHTTLRLTPRDALDVIPLIPRFYDEPFADASQIPTYLVSRLAREQVTVALSGDGGDELFGGYNRYLLAPRIWNRAGRLPLGLRRALARALGDGAVRVLSMAYAAASRLLPREKRQLIFRDKLQKLAASLPAATREEFFHNLASYWVRPGELVSGGEERATRFNDPGSWPAFGDYERWMMAMDMQTYLPGDVLTKVDRASMAVSLEARVPLIDHKVAEFALSLPLAMKIKNGRGKHLLRRVLARHVPEALVDRPKQGFGIPIDAWLRGPLKDWARDLLAEDRLRRQGYLTPGPVQKRLRDHLAGRSNGQYHLWGLLMFQAWLEEHEA